MVQTPDAVVSQLKKRLPELDRYRRDHSIRHLRLFGSLLSSWEEGPGSGHSSSFQSDSDIDLLVEFEPSARVTLLDMARMEREIGELIGFKVDLRTAGDLSRHFREEVLAQAVEL